MVRIFLKNTKRMRSIYKRDKVEHDMHFQDRTKKNSIVSGGRNTLKQINGLFIGMVVPTTNDNHVYSDKY
jgi:hypothetical protein